MSQKEGITVVLSGVNPKVEAVLRRNNFEKLLGKENICSISTWHLLVPTRLFLEHQNYIEMNERFPFTPVGWGNHS